MHTDRELLERYTNRGSEAAFRELVERYISLVHSAALRESNGDGVLAEDIAQAVFTELARHAVKLTSHPALSGWLYTCVRRKTANVRRTEQRRHRREHEAFIMNQLLGSDATDQLWQEVRSVLDDAMHDLNEDDRTVVVLRFFENRNLKDIGLALGLSENAARMRVERSLEKLRSLLERRGVNSTAATLSAVLATGAVLTVPSALAATIATGALAAAGASGSLTLSVVKMLGLTKAKLAAVCTLLVAVGAFTLWNRGPVNYANTASTDQAPAVPVEVSPSLATATEAQELPATAASPAANESVPLQMPLQILDAETGDPLIGAKLYLAYFHQNGRTQRQRRTTDLAGKVGVDITQSPIQALNMFVTADGHVPKVISWGYGRPMPPEYTMRLERGVTLSAIVVDETGLPIPGAKVEINGPGNDQGQEENIQFGPDTSFHTDAEGRWTCNMLPKNTEDLSLIVTHSDYAETNVPVQTRATDLKELSITLPTGFEVKGTVEDLTGNAIEGAKVRHARLNGDRERSGKTDASGVFEFRNTAAGDLLLAVQAEGFAPKAQTLQLTSSVVGLRFRLEPGRLLRGHVIDEEGKAIPEARVTTTRSDVDKVEWSSQTDTGGRFAWSSAPAETLPYSIQADGFEAAWAVKLAADGSDHEIRLTRPRPVDGVRVTATVVDAETGQGLDAFKVLRRDVEPEFAFPFEFATTGRDGRFALSIPDKSRYQTCQLVVEKEGYLPEVSATFAKKSSDQTFEFRLRKGSGPSGVVLLPDGSPAANATVLLCTSGAGVTLGGPAKVERGVNTTTHRVQTDRAGHFQLLAALSPRGVIAVHDEGFAESSLTDLQSQQQLTLQPWGRVEGQLIIESKPAAGQSIVAFNQIIRYDNEGRHSGYLTYRFETMTDASGKFAFPKVPAGRCRVFHQFRQTRYAFESHSQSIAVAPGETIPVTLGGSGRSVVARARFSGDTGHYDWRGVLVTLRPQSEAEPGPRPKRAAFSVLEAYIAACESHFEGYQKLHRYAALCDSNGAFRIPDVPPDTYTLEIHLREDHAHSVSPHDWDKLPKTVASLKRTIFLQIPESQTIEPLDLGILDLAPENGTAEGQ